MNNLVSLLKTQLKFLFIEAERIGFASTKKVSEDCWKQEPRLVLQRYREIGCRLYLLIQKKIFYFCYIFISVKNYHIGRVLNHETFV